MQEMHLAPVGRSDGLVKGDARAVTSNHSTDPSSRRRPQQHLPHIFKLGLIGRLHRTRTTGIRSTGLVRQDRQILTNKDK